MGAAPARIVIVGGGFAGVTAASRLERLLTAQEADVRLIDERNYSVFHPLLIEAGSGALEPRHVVAPIRGRLRRARFKMGEVVGADLRARTVRVRYDALEREERIEYDHLALAPGSVTRLPGNVPGLREHGLEMKGIADAVAFRDRANQHVELAAAAGDAETKRALLTFVVVGGNFTGTEVAGEFQAFVRRAARGTPGVSPDDVRFVLVEMSERILSALGDDLSDFALAHLRRRGGDVRLRTTETRIEPERGPLSTGEAIAARTVLWCAGIAPAPLVARLVVPRDERGYILCEPDLRVRGMENVWAIGDSAVNPGPDGAPYPATAQHAILEGGWLAKNLAAVVRGGAARPCVVRAKGSLAALGCRTGVARVFGVKISGFGAWWLWRTVYLLKMPGLAKKVRIAADWTLDLILPPRDVQLGVHEARRAERGKGGG